MIFSRAGDSQLQDCASARAARDGSSDRDGVPEEPEDAGPGGSASGVSVSRLGPLASDFFEPADAVLLDRGAALPMNAVWQRLASGAGRGCGAPGRRPGRNVSVRLPAAGEAAGVPLACLAAQEFGEFSTNMPAMADGRRAAASACPLVGELMLLLRPMSPPIPLFSLSGEPVTPGPIGEPYLPPRDLRERREGDAWAWG